MTATRRDGLLRIFSDPRDLIADISGGLDEFINVREVHGLASGRSFDVIFSLGDWEAADFAVSELRRTSPT
jgi:hypothetical protein